MFFMRKEILSFLRMLLLVALVPALCLNLVSCDDSESEAEEIIPPVVTVPNDYVNYFLEDATFDCEAGEVKVAFQINVDWTLEVVSPDGGAAPWCSVDMPSGNAGLHKVKVRVSENKTYDSRSARIHLKSRGQKIAEIVVNQDYMGAVLLVRKDYAVSYEATTIDVELESNVEFRYKVEDADGDEVYWVREQPSSSRGLTAHSLVFEVDENSSCQEREAYILFYNKEYDVADTLTLVQGAYPWSKYAVDLGLPSGVKWAACNVGANSPEDYGDYFAWGETSPKETYNWSTYKWCKGTYDTQTKYCTNSSYGTVDYKTTLEAADDAATVNMGDNWRMPTLAEIKELLGECTWWWTTRNGVKGMTVAGPNGNSIFLPAAGYRYGSNLSDAGSYGYYWSASLTKDYPINAYYLYFYSDYYERNDWDNCNRYYGYTVRAVVR